MSYIAMGAFYECSSLESVTIGNSVSEISDWAFYGCTSLTSIIIPSNVTFIGDAFIYSALEEITFLGNCPFFTREPETRTLLGMQDSSGTPVALFFWVYDEDHFYNEGTGESCFEGVTAYGYYPADNATWTEDMLQDYGGDITWVSYDTSNSSGEDETESTEAETTEAETTEAETTEAETIVSGDSKSSDTTTADAEATTTTSSGSVNTSDLSIYVLIALVMMLGVSGFMIRKLSIKDSTF